MNIKPLLKFYYIGLGILFFVLGVTFQSGIISRKLSFIIYTGLLFSILLFMIMDKEFSFKSKWEIIDFRELFLFVAMATYRISIYKYYGVTDLHETIMCILIPVMLYMFGKYYVLYAGEDSYKKIKVITIPFGMGLMVSYLVSVYSFYYFHVDIEKHSERAYGTIIMPEMGVTNATFFSFYPLLLISLMIYCVFSLKNKLFLNLLIIVLALLSAIWSWCVVKQRMPLIFLILTIVISFSLSLIDKIIRNGFNKYKKYIFNFVVVLLGALIIIFFVNLFTGIVTEKWESSILSRNGGVFWGNLRFKLAFETIKDLKSYPFGNNHLFYYKNKVQTHMQWVDFAYCGGIVPFLSIMLWLVLLVGDICRISISDKIVINNKLLIIMPFLAFFVYSTTEMLRNLYYMFYAIMIFAGMICGSVKKLKMKVNKNEKID